MRTIKIGITGGIGSGKSTVANIIAHKGYPVFSCDKINKNLLNEQTYIQKIRKIFPECITEDGISKTKLSELVFSDPQKLKRLNAISHPLILNELQKNMENSNSPICFAEVPLLFESGSEYIFDKIIVVLRNKAERIEAICKRDSLNSKSVLSRIDNQYNYDLFLKQGFAHDKKIFLLKNDAGINHL